MKMPLVSSSDSAAKDDSRLNWFSWVAIITTTMVVLGFYHWTYTTNLGFGGGSLYDLSVDGYLKGQLSFAEKPRPELLAMPNPYASELNSAYAIREASLYHGRYYLYFGPIPAVTFFLPLRLLTGSHIGDGPPVIVFGAGCFLLSVLILLRFRSFLHISGPFPLVLCTLALGFCNYLGDFMRRPAIFETAIICAAFWLMFSTYCMVSYFATGANRYRYLVGSGLCMGFAIGCRYGYILCSVMLVLPALAILAAPGGPSGRRYGLAFRHLLAGLLPWGAVFSLLLLHNYARFDNPFEFGQIYQLTSLTFSTVRLTSLTFIPHNFAFYFLSWIKPDVIFPFFHETSNHPLIAVTTPKYYWAMWSSVGVFNTPFILFCGLAGVMGLVYLVRRRSLPEGAALWVYASILISAAANIFVLLIFNGVVVRYLMDFVPLLLLLSCFSYLLLEGILASRRRALLALRLAAGILLLYGVAVNLALSMEGDAQVLKRTSNPKLFAEMEGKFEFVPKFFFREQDYGAVALQAIFSMKPEAAADPLVTTGDGWLSDIVAVTYPAPDTIQFVYYHDLGDATGVRSKPVTINPTHAYRIEIEMGSLYPRPMPFLLARGFDPGREHRLQVKLDGEVVMEGTYTFYDSLPRQVAIGRNKSFPTPPFFNPGMFRGTFGGRILESKRLPFLQGK